MKKSVAIGLGIGIVLLVAVLASIFIRAREPISLTFLRYEPWRQAAKLKLTNNSSKTITYLTDIAGDPVLAFPKTSTAWTNSLREVITGTTMDPATGKSEPMYMYADLGFFTNGHRGHIELLHPYNLKPGQSAELYVSLQVDRTPIRVGVVCLVPQRKAAQQFSQWVNRAKRWCRMKQTASGQVEIWCDKLLQLPSSPTHGTNHSDL